MKKNSLLVVVLVNIVANNQLKSEEDMISNLLFFANGLLKPSVNMLN